MKQMIGVDVGSYAFNAAAKTITLTGLNPLALEQILLITNVNTNKIIYQFNKVGYGATIAANVLTLDFNTASMSNSDNLQIFIDYESQTPLPVGSSTSSNQTNASQKTQIVDGGGNVISSTANALNVNIASGVTLEVNLDEANDSIQMYGYDGTVNRAIKTNATGELQVVVTNTNSGDLNFQYNEILSVAASVLTIITTYVAVLNDYIQVSTFSGTNIAEYTILVNSIVIMKKRTEFTSLNDSFNFASDGGKGYKLNAGDVVHIKVIHIRPSIGDFNNTLQILNQ